MCTLDDLSPLQRSDKVDCNEMRWLHFSSFGVMVLSSSDTPRLAKVNLLVTDKPV